MTKPYSTRKVIIIACLQLLAIGGLHGQTALTAYTTTTSATTATTLSALPGHISGGNSHIHSAANVFNAFFGTVYGSPSNTAATVNTVTGFTAGGNTYSFVASSAGKPFTKLTMNRVNNAAFTGNRFSGFFQYSSVRTAAGATEYRVATVGNNLNLYLSPTVLYTMEDVLNNYVLAYGTDNIFSNCGTGNAGSQATGAATIYSTGNNIERVDCVYQPGLGATTATGLQRLGFLVNERGGNDVFKVAAITGINASGAVTSLGTVVSVAAASWGLVGPNVSTMAFMGAEGAGNIKPKELVGMAGINTHPPVTQQVGGIYFSLNALGIAVNTRIYGLAIFPGDINANYLTLTGTPTNTTDAGNGGLDLMSGNSFARATTNFDILAQTLSGKVWNDVNGNGIDDGASEANISGTNASSGGSIAAGSNLYVNIVVGGMVVAVVPVNADGTYTYNGMLPNMAYTLTLTSTPGTVGSTVSPSSPSGWANTSDNQNGVIDASTVGQVAFTSPYGTDAQPNVINQDFGLQQVPQSAVNSQVIGVNPGGTVNTTVNPSWFQTSNVGANPNTQDYSGGTVNSIRITAFPSNATSITINGTTYTSATWPPAGVTVPAPGGVPSQPITVDPVNGIVNVVIPFAAIDNAGAEDPTPGSVTLQYIAVLPVKLLSFSAAIAGHALTVRWVVAEEINTKQYTLQQSTDGRTWTDVYNRNAENLRTYSSSIPVSGSGLQYYRLRITDNGGYTAYSETVSVYNTDVQELSVYPNPVSDLLKISFPPSAIGKPGTISITGSDMRLLFSKTVKSIFATEAIAVTALPRGMYVLKIAVQDEITYKKIQVLR